MATCIAVLYGRFALGKAPTMTSSSLDLSAFAGTRVLVAGAGGYIAARLLPQLLEAGAQVAAQASTMARIEHLAVQLIHGPLFVPEVQTEIRNFDAHYVLDLAGRTDQSHSRDNDDIMAINHFGGVRGLGRAVIGGQSLRRWVHTGTNEEYGMGPIPYQEDQREMPVSAYSVSKTASTHHLQMLAREENVPVCIVRPFVVIGPGQDRGLIPFLIGKALADEAFDTTAGTQSRDFVWVDDVIDGIFRAALTPEINGEIFNLASGVETPIRQLVELVCQYGGGGRPNFGAMPLRTGDILRCVADISKARRVLGWAPSYTLEDCVKEVVENAKVVAAQA
jgi:nucleoside-diphosphate-sugar epimerase